MRTLQHFRDFVNEIMESNSRLHKQAVLKKYADDEVVKRYLQIAFDPYKVYGVSTKKLYKENAADAPFDIGSVFELFDYLENHNTGRDVDIAVCQYALDYFGSRDGQLAALLEMLICKDLSIGCDYKTINKEIPGLIKTFSCMLAQKYFDSPGKLEGKTFAITAKLDGFRLIAIKDSSGSVKFYSRVGQLVEGLVEIEQEFKNIPNNMAFDGELTISNYFEMSSKDAYKAASKIIRLKGDTAKTGLTYRVFDCMTAEEFLAQKCDKTYDERRAMLDTFANRVDLKHIEVLPVLYRGDDTSKVIEWLNRITADDGEGVMCNVCSEKYSWTRSWALVKVKKMQDVDLQIIGFEEGSGRLSGTLGALLVRYKNNNIVKVGSGFSDELRKEIWNNQADWFSSVVSVQYFEETNSDNGVSLRFPVFLERRVDKLTPDY